MRVNKHIEDTNVVINKNTVTLELPPTVNGSRLSKWYIDNHEELEDFKEANINGYKRKEPMHEHNVLNNEHTYKDMGGKKKSDDMNK